MPHNSASSRTARATAPASWRRGRAVSTVNVTTPSTIQLDDGAAVTGFDGVDFRTPFDGVHTEANSFGRATGLFGYVNASSNNTTTLDSTVTGTAGAVVAAGPRDPADPVLLHDGGYGQLALDINTTNGSITAISPNSVSRRSLAAGGASGGGGGSDDNHRANVSQTINFNSNATIFSGPSPELDIDAGGNITKAVNVSVNDSAGGGSAQQTSGAIVSPAIVVNPIVNHDPGQVYFSTGGTGSGAINGSGGTWTFLDSFQQVSIVNNSKKPIQLGNMTIVNTTADPVVDLTNTKALGLTFTIQRTVAPRKSIWKTPTPTRPT